MLKKSFVYMRNGKHTIRRKKLNYDVLPFCVICLLFLKCVTILKIIYKFINIA